MANIFEGKTTNEAIEKGLKELKLSRKQVDVKVLESDDKRSFFSILTPRVVKVELIVKEETKKQDNLAELLIQMNLSFLNGTFNKVPFRYSDKPFCSVCLKIYK